MIRYDRVVTKYFQLVLIFSASPSDRSDQFAQTRAEAGPGHTEVRGLQTRYQAHGALQGAVAMATRAHCALLSLGGRGSQSRRLHSGDGTQLLHTFTAGFPSF